MGEIFRVDEHDLGWIEYKESVDADGRVGVRVKALTRSAGAVPPMQYVEYAAGHTDPVHSHDVDEVFVVTDGEVWVDGAVSGVGSVVFVPRDTEYALRAGDEGARFFRVVFPDSAKEPFSEDRAR